MGGRSSAEYDFWKRDDEERDGQNPENDVTHAATNPAALTHNGRISLVPGRPLSPDQRVTPGQRAIPQQGATEPPTNMANDVLTTPQPQSGIPPREGHELDAFLGRAFEEKSVWADLWENVQDIFFPKKLPPLELTS